MRTRDQTAAADNLGLTGQMSPRQRTALRELVQLAGAHSGACLSTRYFNAHTKLRWRCQEGHGWEATPSCIKAGTWCPRCAGRSIDPLAEAQELSRKHGGVCLTQVYVSASNMMRWRCKVDHDWHASLAVVRGGGWCRVCALPGPADLERIARQRGGHCLSSNLTRLDQTLEWLCANGHRWRAQFDRVRRGSWCRRCLHESQRGQSRRRITIADARAVAAERSGACLSSVMVRSDAPLEWRCAVGHTWSARYSNVRRGAWCPTCRADSRGGTLAAMHALAATRNGRCVSATYVHCEAKLLWQCVDGHRWEATPRKIRDGRWCPTCASNCPGSLDEMRALATAHGGVCLAESYANCGARLAWRCDHGHEWVATPASIKTGRWCPTCANLRRRHPRRPRDPAMAC